MGLPVDDARGIRGRSGRGAESGIPQLGATVTRGSFDRSDDDRAAAQQRLTDLSQRYPTIERSRLLLDGDWDGAFRKGLDFLLDGLAPRQ